MSASLSRRDFLIQSIVLTAGTKSRVSAASSTTKQVIVGAHPWVYAATQPNNNIYPILDTIFSDMSYAGFEGIELMHTALRPDDAEKTIQSLSEKHRLPILGTSFGGDFWDRTKQEEILKDAITILPRLARLGGRTLGISVGSAGHLKTGTELDAQADLVKKIILICKDLGILLTLHNHTYEVENGMHDLQGTLARVPNVSLGPDLDWLVQAGIDPIAFLRQFKERILFLHLRDQKQDKTWVESLGEGDMDYKAIGQVLREINFSGVAVIELAHPNGFQPTRPLRDSLKMSRQYVRDTMGF